MWPSNRTLEVGVSHWYRASKDLTLEQCPVRDDPFINIASPVLKLKNEGITA